MVHFQSGSARLLCRLLAGRTKGPVFLAERAPTPARTSAAVDVCPVTGRARLSYRRPAAFFSRYSGGWTLHQLRHSAFTHLADANVAALPLLMARAATKACGRSSATPDRARRHGQADRGARPGSAARTSSGLAVSEEQRGHGEFASPTMATRGISGDHRRGGPRQPAPGRHRTATTRTSRHPPSPTPGRRRKDGAARSGRTEGCRRPREQDGRSAGSREAPDSARTVQPG